MNWYQINLWIADALCILGVLCIAFGVYNPAGFGPLFFTAIVCGVLSLIAFWFAKLTERRQND